MNSSINNKENIREYLLGRVTDDSLLSEIEELLFLDEEFFKAAETEEDELINDYAFGRLEDADKADFEATLARNPERKLGVDLARGLKDRATVPVPAAAPVKTPGFIESIKASFKRPAYGGGVAVLQPAYLGVFAVLLIGIIVLSVLFIPRNGFDDLAELRSMYSQERRTEARISSFDYAPFTEGVRGNKIEEEDSRTAALKSRLLDKVASDPGAKNYHALGVFFLNRKNFPEAIKNFNLALQKGPESGDLHNDLGTAYFELAKLSNDEKKEENMARASGEFSRALELNPDKLEALFNQALLRQEWDQNDRAKESWKLYLQKDPSSKWADEARKRLEELERKRSALKTKEEVLEDFLTAYRNKDDETAWKINCQTRDVFAGVWLPDQLARRYAKAKLKAAAAEEKESIEALTYIGNLEKQRNADFFVSDLAAELSAVNHRNAEKLNAAQASLDEGLVRIRAGNHPDSQKSFETSGASFLQARNPVGEKMARYWMMQALKNQFRNREALQKSDDLLAFTRARNYKWLEASVLYFTGTILFNQKRLSRAMDSYLLSLEAAQRLGDTLLVDRNRITMVENLIETGEYRKALSHIHNDSVDRYYNGRLAEWRRYYFPALLLSKLKLNNAAAEFAFESLATAKNSGIADNAVSSLAMLAQVKAAERRVDDALFYAGESLALLEKQPATVDRKADITLRIANIKSEIGRCEESVTDFQRVNALLNDSEYSVDKYAAHRGLLMCLKTLDRPAEVTAELETVLSLADGYRGELTEDESRQAFFDKEQAVFDIAVEDSLARKDNTGAFERAEGSKARSLLGLIGGENEKPIQPLSVEDIRAKMPSGSQIVEFALLENRLVAWVISNESLQSVDLDIDTSNLNSKIADLARLDADKNSSASLRKSIAAELFQALIAPISKHLDPGKTLIIVPDKSLYYVPFASLVDTENKFLIEQFTVSYSPSATIFISNSEKTAGEDKRGGKVLSIGDPDFDHEEFPGLPPLDSAEDEAREIAAMTGSRPLTGKDATKESFMREVENFQILHFAGHYVANPDVPSGSKLVFAGRGGESGLRMSEFAREKMPNLRLVVLSACETGIENVLEGEGLISASRAFLAAGVPVVVASQWMVDSEATKNLMVAFHRHRQRGLNTAEALRRAQLEMINGRADAFASPYYWAAFGVMGGLEN